MEGPVKSYQATLVSNGTQQIHNFPRSLSLLGNSLKDGCMKLEEWQNKNLMTDLVDRVIAEVVDKNQFTSTDNTNKFSSF